jgi:hypothetical protein
VEKVKKKKKYLVDKISAGQHAKFTSYFKKQIEV